MGAPGTLGALDVHVQCMARLRALRNPDAEFSEAACWAISQLPIILQLPQELKIESDEEFSWDLAETSKQERILHAQTAVALSGDGTAAVLELLVTAILYSSAQTAASVSESRPAGSARQQCSASPLLWRVAQQLLGSPGQLVGSNTSLPYWALVHLSSLWPGEVAAALVACVEAAGASMPDAAGALHGDTLSFSFGSLLYS